MSDHIEREHLQRYIHDLEDKLGWGPIADWGQRDFQQLSDLIEQQCHYPVSVTTLKRALGRLDYKGLPYTATLNALAQVLEYKDWLDYKLHAKKPEVNNVVDSSTTSAPPPPARPAKSRKLLLLIALVGFLIGAGVAVSIILLLNLNSEGDATKTSQQAHYTGPNLLEVSPHSYVDSLPARFFFRYSVPKAYRNNLNVIRFEGRVERPMRPLAIDSSGNGEDILVVTGPGLYNAKIFSNKTELGKQTFMVPTRGWAAKVGKASDYRLVKTMRADGYLSIDRKSFKESKVDTTIDFLTELLRVQDFNTMADDMVLECRVKCPSNNYNSHKPKLAIKGRTDLLPFHITFDASATALSIYNQYADKTLSLDEQKRYFHTTLGDWSYVKLVVRNKHVEVYLNDKQVYACDYKMEMGRLYELSFTSRGLMDVDMVRIKNNAGKVLFEEDF